jgi:thioredoxin-related protein
MLILRLWLVLLALTLPLLASSQEKGIHWAKCSTWEAVKHKARDEKKYIFVDCYTTWCGPCKRMEKEVYIEDTVGFILNDKFISVKVQMDQNETDSDEIKTWYQESKNLQKKFHIVSFPSFVFLSPDGEILHLATGFKPVHQFLATVQTALSQDVVYESPYVRYDELVQMYSEGHLLFEDLPYLVKTSEQLGDTILRQQFLKEFKSRMKIVPKEQLYTQTNIAFMSAVIGSSKSEFFPVFFENETHVNKFLIQLS